jgi:orotate phosphoribosyltransferase
MNASSATAWTRQELAARAARALGLSTQAAGRPRLDKYLLQGDPALLGRLAAAIADQLPPEAQMLAGIELGGVPLATAVSLHTGLPWSLIRRADEAEPKRSRLSGVSVDGRVAVIVKDMAQSGAAIVDAAHALRAAGAVVAHVAVAINWNAELSEILVPIGITPIAALDLADFRALPGFDAKAGG